MKPLASALVVLIQSTSAAAKSALMDRALALVPAEGVRQPCLGSG